MSETRMNDDDTPISNGSNGDSERGADGRFKIGNGGGPGSPVARQARQLRERLNDALFKVCSPDRLLAAVDACLKSAEAGDIVALKFLAERIAGTAVSGEVLDRLELLEQQINNPTASNAGRSDIP
jgi:hypothetical protein